MTYWADFFKVITDGAKGFGALEATGIWALMYCALYVSKWRSDKHHEEYDRQWQEIRTREALADAKLADAVALLAAAFKEVLQRSMEIKIILDERLPRGDKHV